MVCRIRVPLIHDGWRSLNRNKRERETKKQKPYGGMLCDVMGLGKTLQTLGGLGLSLSDTTVLLLKLTYFSQHC